MRVWRIARAAHAAFDGEGARRYGSRWTPKGLPVVFASETLSLAALASIGEDWFRAAKSAVLWVPSAVIPHERNVILNPAHPQFARIRPGAPEPFSFDPRMWKKTK